MCARIVGFRIPVCTVLTTLVTVARVLKFCSLVCLLVWHAIDFRSRVLPTCQHVTVGEVSCSALGLLLRRGTPLIEFGRVLLLLG